MGPGVLYSNRQTPIEFSRREKIARVYEGYRLARQTLPSRMQLFFVFVGRCVGLPYPVRIFRFVLQ